MHSISKESSITLVELPPTQFGIYNGDPGYDVYSQFGLPARAIHALEGVLRAEGYTNVLSINPNYHGKRGRLTPENEERIFTSDVLGISAISRTSPQSMELARRYKKQNPRGYAIAGGFDPTFRFQDWLADGGTDVVVLREGERTLVDLLEKLGSHNLDDVNGIAYRRNGSIRVTDPRALMTSEELAELPHPYYDEKTRRKVNVAMMEASRGCPHNCDFCTVTQFYGRATRRKPAEYVATGLDQIKKMGRELFFVDDEFTMSPKHTLNLLEQIINRDLRRTASAQVTVKAAKNPELIKYLKRAGIEILQIGIESIDDETLASYGKPNTAAQNKEAIEILRDAGFWIHGMLMPGGDGDTIDKLWSMFEWATNSLDSIQLTPPVPFVGTRMNQTMREQGRILSDEAYLYDGHSVLVRPKNITPFELQNTICQMYEKFYSLKQGARRFLSSPKKILQAGIMFQLLGRGLKDKVLYSPQAIAHLEFLKGVS